MQPNVMAQMNGRSGLRALYPAGRTTVEARRCCRNEALGCHWQACDLMGAREDDRRGSTRCDGRNGFIVCLCGVELVSVH